MEKKTSAQLKISIERVPSRPTIYTGLKYEVTKIEAPDKRWSTQQEFLQKYLQMWADGVRSFCSLTEQAVALDIFPKLT